MAEPESQILFSLVLPHMILNKRIKPSLTLSCHIQERAFNMLLSGLFFAFVDLLFFFTFRFSLYPTKRILYVKDIEWSNGKLAGKESQGYTDQPQKRARTASSSEKSDDFEIDVFFRKVWRERSFFWKSPFPSLNPIYEFNTHRDYKLYSPSIKFFF